MKKYTLLVSMVLLSAFTSCKKETPKGDSAAVTNSVSKSSGESAEASYTGDYVVSDAAGKQLGSFSANPPKIQVEGKTFTAKEKEGKRKYYDNGTLTYEVKMNDEGFKLKDASSKLLWKVKIYPDKIKVSNNEENTNPYEIRNNGGVIEVKKDDAKFSTIKIDGTNVMVNEKKAYTFSKNLDSFAVGILSIGEIPMDQRIFILAEYLIQKK